MKEGEREGAQQKGYGEKVKRAIARHVGQSCMKQELEGKQGTRAYAGVITALIFPIPVPPPTQRLSGSLVSLTICSHLSLYRFNLTQKMLTLCNEEPVGSQ